MAYFTLATVKAKLHIDDSDQDTYINLIGAESDAYINTQIAIHAVTPIAVPDAEIKALSDKLSAASYITWNSPDHPRVLYDAARKDVQEYIKAVYGAQNVSGLTNNTFSKTNSQITGFSS